MSTATTEKVTKASRIRELLLAGKSVKEIVRRVKCADTQVYALKKEMNGKLSAAPTPENGAQMATPEKLAPPRITTHLDLPDGGAYQLELTFGSYTPPVFVFRDRELEIDGATLTYEELALLVKFASDFQQ